MSSSGVSPAKAEQGAVSRWYAAVLIGLIAISRIVFRSHYLYDLDSVNFALGMRHFDPLVHQPHPPGYFLYVVLGRLVNRVIADPNQALVAISIAVSCGAAWAIYLLTREWFGGGEAIFSLVLFLVSPLAWFHGVVALTYIVECCFSAITGYCCWRVWRGEARWKPAASVAYALAAGFRPSAALFLGPLWAASMWRGRRYRVMAPAIAAVVILAWLIPMIQASGGGVSYWSALRQAWLTVPARNTTLQSPALAIARVATILWVLLLATGPVGLLVLWPNRAMTDRGRNRFIGLWVTPALVFFSLVFFNYVNSGYLLLVCPPVFAWVSYRSYRFALDGKARAARYAIVGACLAGGVVVFLMAPWYCTYRGIREFEADLTSVKGSLSVHFDPRSTMVVAFDSHFLGFRHAGYYLPDFTVAEYPEMSYGGGKRIFVMRARSTAAVEDLPEKQFRDFLFFPLPGGEEYRRYLEGVLKGLPPGACRPETVKTIAIWRCKADIVHELYSQDHR